MGYPAHIARPGREIWRLAARRREPARLAPADRFLSFPPSSGPAAAFSPRITRRRRRARRSAGRADSARIKASRSSLYHGHGGEGAERQAVGQERSFPGRRRPQARARTGAAERAPKPAPAARRWRWFGEAGAGSPWLAGGGDPDEEIRALMPPVPMPARPASAGGRVGASRRPRASWPSQRAKMAALLAWRENAAARRSAARRVLLPEGGARRGSKFSAPVWMWPDEPDPAPRGGAPVVWSGARSGRILAAVWVVWSGLRSAVHGIPNAISPSLKKAGRLWPCRPALAHSPTETPEGMGGRGRSAAGQRPAVRRSRRRDSKSGDSIPP